MADQQIRLNPEFVLMFDSYGNHWLVKPRVSEAGKEYNTNAYCGYHRSFASLLEAYVKVRLPERDAKTVKAALSNLSEIQEEVKELAREIGQALDKRKKK